MPGDAIQYADDLPPDGPDPLEKLATAAAAAHAQIARAPADAPTLLTRLVERLALLDRIIGKHHDALVMREEFDVCPVCMEAGGADFFATTGALLREARHAR